MTDYVIKARARRIEALDRASNVRANMFYDPNVSPFHEIRPMSVLKALARVRVAGRIGFPKQLLLSS